MGPSPLSPSPAGTRTGDPSHGLRALLEQAPVLVWTCDADARWTYVNRAWLDFTGRRFEDEMGEGWKRSLHPEDRTSVEATCRDALATRRPFQLEYRLRRHDGAWRTLLCTATPRVEPDGSFLGFVGSCVDVTELRQAERRASSARHLLGSVLDALGASIAVLNGEGRILAVNQAWRQFAAREGLAAAKASVGASYLGACDTRHAVGAEHAGRAAQGIREVLAGRRGSFELEYPCHAPDRQRWFLMRVTPVEGASEAAAVVSHVDVTSLRAAEEERSHLERKMQEVQRFESLGVLSGGIAHDFNNVLTVILGNARLMLADLEAESPVRERVARIRSAAEHAAALTEQMLTYSGKASPSLAPLDLNDLVREMRGLLGSSVTERGSLEIDLLAELPAVEGDATQLRQVVLNLVTNASEALGNDGGSVRVRTSLAELDAAELEEALGTPDAAPGKYVVLAVSDSGTGVAPELRGRIFEPFFTTKFSGRGLGLAAVLGIVRGHRGLIRVEPRRGGGTQVRVLLPISATVTTQTPAPARVEAPASTEGATVLVVDDEAWVLELAQEFLQRAGWRVVTAQGGHEALEILRARGDAIDAVVLDLVMPDLDGAETYRELRRLAPTLPVILASGYSEEMAGERFTEPGVAGFLSKPWEPEQLVQALQAALASAPPRKRLQDRADPGKPSA